MNFEHEFMVPASPEVSWKALTDVDRVASCMPGAKLLEVSGEEFTAQLRVKVGPISVAYSGVGHFTEMNEESGRAVLQARGKEMRGSGTANATIQMSLAPDGTGTRVRLHSDLDITGRPAQFGRGVLQDVGASIIEKFATQLVKTLNEDINPGSAAQAEQTPRVFDGAAVSSQKTIDMPPQPEAQPSRSEPLAHGSANGYDAEGHDELNLAAVLMGPMLRRAAPPLVGVVVGALAASLLRGRRREVVVHLHLRPAE